MDFTNFLKNVESLPLIIVAFVVALSVIVAVHEYGHYIVGRWSGIKAEVFSLGFGPVLWSRMDKHGTKWQFAALPFGGFVKFLGDANAASGKDGEAMEELPPEMLRQTMHGAPLWARAATVAAGPIFNFILSIFVFAGVLYFDGKTIEPLTVAELREMPAIEGDLRPGDVIERIGGLEVPAFDNGDAFEAFRDAIPREKVLPYVVERGGERIEIEGPYPYPPLVTRLQPKSAAYDIGMQQGDLITAIDGNEIFAFDQLKDRVEGGEGTPLLLDVWRPNDGQGEMLQFTLVPRRTDEPQQEGGFKTFWRIGIASGLVFEPATETPGLGETLWAGVQATWATITTALSGLWHLIIGSISTCNMSGPIGIAEVSGAAASQGVSEFIFFIAALSTAVGLLNLFPIPVLDGGHLVFYAYEAVAGRPPSDKALRILMSIGLAVILSVMVFALSNDIFCP